MVRDTTPKNEKWVKKGRVLGHVTYFSNFETPQISRERLKAKNSNLAGRLIVRNTNPKMKNGSKGGVA